MKIQYLRWIVTGVLLTSLLTHVTIASAQTERSIRAQLGIPNGLRGPRNVFVIGEASHNDYDWVCTFLDFYGKPKDGKDPDACASGTYDRGRTVYNVFKAAFGQD